MRNINVGLSVGVVEFSVLLGPLPLNSTLRLFARLTPSLSTAQAKADFIDALLPIPYSPGYISCSSSVASSTVQNNHFEGPVSTTRMSYGNSNNYNNNNSNYSNIATHLLTLFGEGHPAKIVHMACESTPESVRALKELCIKIIYDSSYPSNSRASSPTPTYTNGSVLTS